jgi:translation initiation factor 2D
MFKRPHSSKTTTPLRSSDLRKLREEISRVYPACSSSIKQLLPDSSLTGKATTHLDEPLTIYYSPHGPDPKFFRLGKGTQGEIVPTCYAFDLVPTLVPQLETAEAVVDNLQSGSALFTAGVSLRSLRALPDDVKPGQLVSIVVYDHPRTIVAVGHLAASKRELLDDARDKKGKAVLTVSHPNPPLLVSYFSS